MPAFISENLSTILVSAVVLGFVAFALIRIILNLRKGKSSCGCGCEKCPWADDKHRFKVKGIFQN
jgi:hypothetical protein